MWRKLAHWTIRLAVWFHGTGIDSAAARTLAENFLAYLDKD